MRALFFLGMLMTRSATLMPSGKWIVADTNDRLMKVIPPPIQIQVKGDAFSIGTRVKGTFRLLRGGEEGLVEVATRLWDLPFTECHYHLHSCGPECVVITKKDGDVFYRLVKDAGFH